MITEDQVVALFAKANPVPSLELLDPVEPFDVSHLANRSERSSAMTDIKTEEVKAEPVRRPRLALVLAVALIGLIALGILVARERPVATPESIANAFMEARANLDAEAASALFAPDGVLRDEGFELSQLPALFDWYRASNWDWTRGECTEISTGPGGTLVECSNQFENDWSRAMGQPPTDAQIQVLLSDGEITSLTSVLNVNQFGDVWEAFIGWIAENHPDDFEQMYVQGGTSPLVDPTSIALWEQYTKEFVASFE